jgi:hypothetical protein
MSAPSSKIEFSNRRSEPHVVAVEPWGEDYTLLPGEALEVVAFGEAAAPWFHVVESDGVSQVYCEQAALFKVLQAGVELECGHNRRSGSV